MAHARIFQARILGRMHGQQTVNVLNFGSDETPADNAALVAILIELATNIIECALAALVPAATQDWTFETVEAKQLYPTVSDPVQQSAPAGSTGGTNTQNVSFSAVLMNIRTGGGGRRGRGRLFLPPPGDSHITDSVLIAGTAQDFYSQFITCLSGKYIGSGKTENQFLGVLSRKAASLGGTLADAFRDAVSLEVNQQISCLRSRKVGHGS